MKYRPLVPLWDPTVTVYQAMQEACRDIAPKRAELSYNGAWSYSKLGPCIPVCKISAAKGVWLRQERFDHVTQGWEHGC